MNEEVLENVIDEETVEYVETVCAADETGSGLGKVVVLGIAAAGALGALVYSKIKKKGVKPNKKKKLMWVEVEDEDAEEEVVTPEYVEVVENEESNK